MRPYDRMLKENIYMTYFRIKEKLKVLNCNSMVEQNFRDLMSISSTMKEKPETNKIVSEEKRHRVWGETKNKEHINL